MQCIFIHTSNLPKLCVLDSVTISVLLFHFQAWLTEIHEYAQQDVVVMLLGNKVRTFLPMCADVWTDGLRGRREGRHYDSCIKPTFISAYLRQYETYDVIIINSGNKYQEWLSKVLGLTVRKTHFQGKRVFVCQKVLSFSTIFRQFLFVNPAMVNVG